MGLLAKHRRLWLALVLPLLFVPMLAQLVTLQNAAPFMRRDSWLKLPASIDAYLRDNFGLREALLGANAKLRYALRSPTTDRVAYGKDGWLFLTDDAVMQQFMGERYRVNQVTAMADFVARMRDELERRGAKLIVAVPPNSQSINLDVLPDWTVNRNQPTEYDLFKQLVAERHIRFTDLKAVLLEAKRTSPVYLKTDTHWNNHGALIAFNAIMRDLALNDWAFDPVAVEKGFEPIGGGDLARMLALSDQMHDEQVKLDLGTQAKVTTLDLNDREIMPSYVDTRDPADPSKPTVMIFGDSFTRGHFRELLLAHAGRLIWTHHRQCGFDWSLLETYKPDIVIFAPTERYVLCAVDRVPANMPR